MTTFIECGKILFAIFPQIMCEAILKEIKSYERAHDHKVIDVWLLLIIYANGGPYKKLAESILKKKAAAGLFGKNLFNQCIKGRLLLLQVSSVTADILLGL